MEKRPFIVAGGESAGIPFAAFLAVGLGLPMVYVRKTSKEHGTKVLIEGIVSQGDYVVLVEDLITDGKSKMRFINPLRDAGCIVEHCLVILDREQGGEEQLSENGIKLHSLTTLSSVLQVGKREGIITKNQLEEIDKYLVDPETWHYAKGLGFIC